METACASLPPDSPRFSSPADDSHKDHSLPPNARTHARVHSSRVHQTAPCPLLTLPSQFLFLLFFPSRPHLPLPLASHFPAAYLSPCHHFSPSFMPFCLRLLLSCATSSSSPHPFFEQEFILELSLSDGIEMSSTCYAAESV